MGELAKFTKGPWQARPQADGYIIAREGVTVVGHSIAGVRQSRAVNEAQCEANAHLIASAPDYDAFAADAQWEVILGALDSWTADGGSELVALGVIGTGLLKLDALRRAALAKARGESLPSPEGK